MKNIKDLSIQWANVCINIPRYFSCSILKSDNLAINF
jgi:hypothetical protein